MTAADERGARVSLLLICHSYPPVMGGSEIEAQRVSAALIRRGYQVTVLCAGGPPMPDVRSWVDPCGIPVRLFGRGWSGRWRDRIFALGVAWTLFRERRNYQLVYFLMQGLHVAVGLPVARLLRKPVVMKFSGSGLITLMRKSWVGRLELRWLRDWTKRIMILNSGMAAEAVAGGLAPEHLLWMPNPVNIDEFAPCGEEQRQRLRSALAIPAESPVVTYVGRLAPEKELPSLFEGFRRVAAQLPEALLLLVGDGPDRGALEALADRLGLRSHIRFTGRINSAEVRQWLQASDVFALVSSNEGFSCSLTEAMATALPAVVSAIPANTQLIDHEAHGLIVKFGDAPAIGDALLRLLQDRSLRHRLGRMSRQRVVENYAADRVVDRYEELFKEILSQPAARLGGAGRQAR